MSYTVLARKFRSQSFDEVVGQGPIVQTLKNAIEQGRIHHGYLFCGTRGVGKTSMARIMAKALNCLSSDKPTMHPCGTCDSCQGIARGEDIDVLEIDAASNTGVENIRELRSNAIYRPARSRYKIYIIDEVHMLSTGAFNALLKTLEEPPDHVKFIFATTEAQKVPATIHSRVQRFDFKSIPPGEIAGQLASICEQEHVKAEEAALKRLARLANGSMRDALSLLDQVLSMSGAIITAQIVDELLPPAHDEVLGRLIDALADGDPGAALAVVDVSLGQGHTLDYWCSLFIGQLRDLMMLRVCGKDTDLVDVPAGLRDNLVVQSSRFDSGAYVYMITLLEELRRSVKSSGSGRALVEAAVVRLAEASNFSSIKSIIDRLNGQPGAPAGALRSAAAPRLAVEPVDDPLKKKALASDSSPSMAPERAARPAMGIPREATAGPASSVRAAGPGREAAFNRPESPPPDSRAGSASGPSRRMTRADLAAAEAEPLVQVAVEIFDGQIVDVQQGGG